MLNPPKKPAQEKVDEEKPRIVEVSSDGDTNNSPIIGTTNGAMHETMELTVPPKSNTSDDEAGVGGRAPQYKAAREINPAKLLACFSAMLVALPLMLFGYVSLTNPSAYPYYLSEIDRSKKNYKGQIHWLTEAMGGKTDLMMLQLRANAYAQVNDPVKEAADLTVLESYGLSAAQTSTNGLYYRLALARFRAGEPLANVTAALNKYIDKQKDPEFLYIDDEDPDIMSFLISEKPEQAQQWHQGRIDDLVKPKNENLYVDQKKNHARLEEALCARALGKANQAREALKQVDSSTLDDHFSRFDILSKPMITVLLNLDEKLPPGIDLKVSDDKNAKAPAYMKGYRHACQLFNGWASLQNGNSKTALAETDKLLDDYTQKDWAPLFVRAEFIAACRYLRELAYLEQGNEKAAEREHSAYLATRATGKLFIPRCYWKT